MRSQNCWFRRENYLRYELIAGEGESGGVISRRNKGSRCERQYVLCSVVRNACFLFKGRTQFFRDLFQVVVTYLFVLLIATCSTLSTHITILPIHLINCMLNAHSHIKHNNYQVLLSA